MKPKHIVHISAECYPLAKAGGLADVVGALPKYQIDLGVEASVLMPRYHLPGILERDWTVVHQGSFHLGSHLLDYSVHHLPKETLGFPVFAIDIPGKFDRPGIYNDEYGNFYDDGPDRYLAFQHTALLFLDTLSELPDVIHCHDHHAGIIPFLMKHGMGFGRFRNVPSVFTIHNGKYHGSFGWEYLYAMPFFDWSVRSLLDWGGVINPLAVALKMAWKVTTVSPSYLDELRGDSDGLEPLIQSESAKSVGILNGIDTDVWNPATDPLISTHLKKSVRVYKKANRDALLKLYPLDRKRPIVSFIGRFANEKAADLLPEVIHQTLASGIKVNFLILGSGNPWLHHALNSQRITYGDNLAIYIGYNEQLAHQIYAGSDFLMMPSRVEPCGLNQMYAMRYGTIPMVRRTGGLNDSVIDIGDTDGRGIMFNHASVGDITHALSRAENLYRDTPNFELIRERIMAVDFSWQTSAKSYLALYETLT